MAEQYDLVVIGTGTAAMVAAMRVRAAGWSVAIIDYRPFGGTCALRVNRLTNLTPYRRPILTPSRGVI